MRILANISNVDAPSSDFPKGRVRNKNTSIAPAIIGTPIVEEWTGDMVQFFQRLLTLAGVTANDLPDNVTNGYQTVDALFVSVLNQFLCSDANFRNGLISNKFIVPSNFNQAWQTLTPPGGWSYTASGMTITIGTNDVKYIKIGRFIFIDFFMLISIAVSTGGNQIKITSLNAGNTNILAERTDVNLIPFNSIVISSSIADVSLSSDRWALYLNTIDGSNFAGGSSKEIRFTKMYLGGPDA